MTTPNSGEVRNQLLRRLQPQDYERLLPHLRNVTLGSGQILYEARAPIDFVYFPQDCVLSAVTLMSDGRGMEAGTVGYEGSAGLTAFLGQTCSPQRVLAQIAGDAQRIAAG